MDQEYDIVICGTGLKECIISGLAAKKGYKVLHLDENDYYGEDCASLTYSALVEKYGGYRKKMNLPDPLLATSSNKEWSIDLIIKFIMASGRLVDMLIDTNVKEYIQFQNIAACYVYHPKSAGWITAKKTIHKVPATEMEVLSSNLIPLSEKLRSRQFFILLAQWDENDPKTWDKFNPFTDTIKDCYEKYNLCDDTREFIGHAIALEYSDDYLNKPCGEIMKKLKQYVISLLRFSKSPFIYPIYGLSCLSEGFSRLSAVHGGTFILRAKVDYFKINESTRKVEGIMLKTGEFIKCKKVVCSSTYCHYINYPKIKKVGNIARIVSILEHPLKEASNVDSCQIIFPQAKINRKYDAYATVLSNAFDVCPTGKYIAIASTLLEGDSTDDETVEKQLDYALKLFEPIYNRFTIITEMTEPIDDAMCDNIFVTASFDPSSHFEQATQEVVKLFDKISN